MLLRQFPDKDHFHDLAKSHNVIPVCAEILADTETPVSLLKKFYNQQQPVFLLESVEGGERWGRYSFLGTSVRSDIRIYADEVKISEEDLKSTALPITATRYRSQGTDGSLSAGPNTGVASFLGRHGRLFDL